jgi:hypothetical protein
MPVERAALADGKHSLVFAPMFLRQLSLGKGRSATNVEDVLPVIFSAGDGRCGQGGGL